MEKKMTLTELFNNMYNKKPEIHAFCPRCKFYPEVVFCTVENPIMDEDEETIVDSEKFHVQLDNSGVSNNLFHDGTSGVPDDIQAAAEESEDAICPECNGQIEWIKNKVEYHEWFERGYGSVELREYGTDMTLVEFRDQEISDAVEAGILDPRNYQKSLREYARANELI